VNLITYNPLRALTRAPAPVIVPGIVLVIASVLNSVLAVRKMAYGRIKAASLIRESANETLAELRRWS
jgi:hypothetical protein